MKKVLLAIFLLSALALRATAQEIDTIPIPIKGLEIKLNKNPLPIKRGAIKFEPVNLAPAVIQSRISYWKTRTNVGINLNQAAFSNNWKGGGVNSIAIGGIINWKAEYAKEGFSYTSELGLQYGKIKNKDQLQKKTNDRIYFDNKAAIQLSKSWFFYGSITFESQFDKGFSYRKDASGNEVENLLSRFMSPGYLTESFGFEYKPNKFFSSRIGTGTARQTFVLDTALYHTNPANFGVARGKTLRNELAFQVLSNFEKEIATNLFLKARYNMFIPYNSFANIDHRLDLNLTAKVNKIINVSVTGVGIYDRDQDTKLQASQSLALGLSFTFPR